MPVMTRPAHLVGFDSLLTRRSVVRAGAASGGALLLAGRFGATPGLGAGRDEDGSPLYGDLGSAEEVLANAELFERLDRVGSLDYSTGLVSVDPDGLMEALAGSLEGRQLESAHAAFLRHAELGFAVDGDAEAVAAGRATCLPWSVVEYLVGEGQDQLPLDYQYAILADLGVLEASSEAEVVEIVLKRFPNVPPELGGEARARKRALPPAQDYLAWVTGIFKIIQVIIADFKPEPAKVKRNILQCVQAARTTVHWWGMKLCFDSECTQTLIEYLRAGGNALTSSSVLTAVAGLGFPWWVAAIIAGGLLGYGIWAKIMADALQDRFDRSGGCGACVDYSWFAWLGIPAIGASAAC
jgi:hypothetical protein